jgi:hypothetical protein
LSSSSLEPLQSKLNRSNRRKFEQKVTRTIGEAPKALRDDHEG